MCIHCLCPPFSSARALGSTAVVCVGRCPSGSLVHLMKRSSGKSLLFHGPGYKGHVMSHTVHVAWHVMELLERLGTSIGARLHAAACADDDPGGEATEMLAFGGHDTKGVKEVRLLLLS